ncbi:MAG: ribokinase [Spirochaetia bacterium]|jgi:ribokinase
MGAPRIGVFGGINMDLVIQSEKLPRPGETIKGTSFTQAPGGKGANQAVAAAKMGGEVVMFGHVGDDSFGSELLTGMDNAGVDCSFVGRVRGKPTGLAFIVVDRRGENAITFVGGANDEYPSGYIAGLRETISACDVVLVQLECRMEAVSEFLELANEEKVPIILNPAPAVPLRPELIARCKVIAPNETEAEALTGIRAVDPDSAARAARVLAKEGCPDVIITMGAAGAFVLSAAEGNKGIVPAPTVSSVDTVAAGDVFLGAFAVRYASGDSLMDATIFANYAAALSTTRPGAQPSIPALEEVKSFKASHQEALG